MLQIGSSESDRNSEENTGPKWQLARIRSASWFISMVVNLAALTVSFNDLLTHSTTSDCPPAPAGGWAVTDSTPSQDSMFFGLIVPFLPNLLKYRVGLVDDAEIQLWNSVLVGVYGGAVFIGSPIFGYFADKAKSRKIPLLLGYLSLAASTVLLHLGNSLALLVLGRILQGLSSACVSSVGFAILFDAFGTEEAGGAMGWVAASLDAGGFIGPALAGVLFNTGGEMAVFIFAYAFICFDILLGLLVILDRTQPDKQPLASSSALSDSDSDSEDSSTAVASTEASDSEDNNSGSKIETSSSDDGSGSAFAAAKPRATAYTTESRPAGVSFRRLMLNPRLLAAFAGWLVVGSFETAFDSVLPIFVEQTYHWAVLGAGLIFLGFYLPGIIVSPICGYIMDRVRNSPRVLCTLGFALSGPSFILLGLAEGPQIGKQALLCVLLSVVGIGTGLSGPPLLKEVGTVVELAERKNPGAYGPKGSDGPGLRRNLLGPVLAGAMKAAYGWAVMGWVFGIVSLVMGGIVVCSLEGWIWNTRFRRDRTIDSAAEIEVEEAV
ncbi:MFS amine transporter [Apiospora rasikravindrae]|uniref:MFS amine transporter n=1 Tax=Apiospora rasikravindrae TaxID=990691 RepID=A0ABR1RWV7_9PEZI